MIIYLACILLPSAIYSLPHFFEHRVIVVIVVNVAIIVIVVIVFIVTVVTLGIQK